MRQCASKLKLFHLLELERSRLVVVASAPPHCHSAAAARPQMWQLHCCNAHFCCRCRYGDHRRSQCRWRRCCCCCKHFCSGNSTIWSQLAQWGALAGSSSVSCPPRIRDRASRAVVQSCEASGEWNKTEISSSELQLLWNGIDIRKKLHQQQGEGGSNCCESLDSLHTLTEECELRRATRRGTSNCRTEWSREIHTTRRRRRAH